MKGIRQNLWDWLKEHLRDPSLIHHHSHSTGHPVSPEYFTIVDKEVQGVTRNKNEAMYIHVNDPSLNRNLGTYQLSHIWDKVYRTAHHFSSNNTALPPTFPYMGHPSPIGTLHNKMGGMHNFSCQYYPMRGDILFPIQHPSIFINPPAHSKHQYTPNSQHPHFSGTIFGKYSFWFM